MLNKFFPYKLHLQILQQDEYSSAKLLQWIAAHFFTRTIENKKPLIWTQKAKMIYYLSLLFTFLSIILLTSLYNLFGFVFGIVLATQSYIFLLIASLLLSPLENYQKNKIKKRTEEKLRSFKKLKIIGITGSYGKTSVKEFLYQILKTEHTVLKTPESYNTPLGIAKVVDLELDDSYEYFICEMGAYRVGDIKEICDMVHPKYGILTGINEQHLETFGSLENTTKGKFELIDALPKGGFGLVNAGNQRIREEYKRHTNTQLSTYEAEKKFDFNYDGMHFNLFLNDGSHRAKTNLLGYANLENITAAAAMANHLGMKPQAIIEAIANLTPVPHRVEFKPQENMIIIDDAYNSNYDGFKNAVEVLTMFDSDNFKRTRILVTPGIVDLGKETFKMHKKLAEEISKGIAILNYIILVGKSERTNGLKEGIADKKKIIEVDSLKDAWKEIEKLNVEHPIILLENDLPDNY